MTHEDLFVKILASSHLQESRALRAVVELHKPAKTRSVEPLCDACTDIWFYPCPTIQAIEKALMGDDE